MAVSAAIKVGAKVLKGLSAVFGSKKTKDSSAIKVIAIICLALVLLILFMFCSAPFALWAIAEGVTSGSLGTHKGSGQYVIASLDDTGNLIDGDDSGFSIDELLHYINEEKRIEKYAKSKWQSDGKDQYTLPDWRFLWALDCALSLNDFKDVLDRSDHYKEVHENILRAKLLVKQVIVEEYEFLGLASDENIALYEDDPDVYKLALTDDLAFGYYRKVLVSYDVNYWYVNFDRFNKIFISSAIGISDELMYFKEFESGEYKGSWGDGGNALGAYQFDRRYALQPFLNYCFLYSPTHYSIFKDFLIGTIEQGDRELEVAWQLAYDRYSSEFSKLQDDFELETRVYPAQTMMLEFGIDTSKRRDCIKGLFAGIYNLFGSGGARALLSEMSLEDYMSDLKLATVVCEYIQKTRAVYAPRYARELETIKTFLSQDPKNINDASLIDETQIKKTLAQNYYASLRFISLIIDPSALLKGSSVFLLVFDNEGFTKYMSDKAFSTQRGAEDLVDIAQSQIGNVGGEMYWMWYQGYKEFWCAMFVSWCADQCGYIDDGAIPKFKSCDVAIAWFKSNGVFENREYVPNPGDIIFFDWGDGGIVDHTGIVASCDGSYVYTIEGNSGDAVRSMSYPVGDFCIVGYGCPQF